MAYKFQRGNARMSGSLTQEEGLTVVKGGATVTAGGVTITAGGLDLNAGGADFNNTGLTNVGAVSGVTTVGTSGAATLDSGGNGSTFGGALTTTGILKTDDTTEATSTTDGSLQTDGGLSVAKSAVIGDDLDLLSNSAIINVGSSEKWTATHANANNTLTVTSAHRLAFGDAGDYISGDGTDLKIVSSGDVDITGDTDVVGGLSSTQATTLASVAGVTTVGSTTGATFSAAGLLNVNNATDATSKTDGSLQTDGGLSVAKAIYNGTAATFAADSGVVTIGSSTAATFSAAGLLSVNNATEATSATDGSLQTDGGLSVVKSAVIGDDLDLLSDLAILNFGADKDTNLTHVADTGLLLNSSRQIQFGDSGTHIAQAADGELKLTSDSLLEMSVGAAGVKITGTTPKLTLGDAGAEDTTILFDGNAKDFYVALDDTADKLVIGEGSTVGTNNILTLTDDTVTLGDGGAADTNLVFDGNAADWSIGIDDSDDVLEIRHGTTPATDAAIKIDTNGQLLTLNAAAAAVTVSADHIMFYDGGATAIPKVESIADLATAMAGAGITATNGVFSTDASSTPSVTADGTTLSEGFNYFLADLTGSTGAVVLMPATPTVGDILYLKAKGGVSATSTITIKRTTVSHTIDGDASQIVESPYGAVAMSYVAANDWRIF